MPINKIATSSIELQYENYINILRTGQSVSDTGWRTYVNTAGVNPTTGIGGTTGITWSQNNIDPLNSEADLRLVKDANNRQGQGASIDFTIDNRHLAKVLQITFDTELINGNYESPIITPTSGTYIIATGNCTVTTNHSFIIGQVVNMTFTGATPPPNGTYLITGTTATTFVFAVPSGTAGSATPCSYTVPADLRVSIIQDPFGTPVVIEPVNTGISLGISNPRQRIKHIASFQTHISLKTYRLCIHVANASTVAYTVDFANIRVWEPTQSIGAVITDWVSYIPTFTNMGTVTNIDTQWRRVGSNIEVRGRFTVGTTSPALQTFTLPTGLIPNINWTSGNGILVGYITRDQITEGNTVGLLARNDNIIRLGQYVGFPSGNNNVLATGSTNFLASNEPQNFYFSVPILGWGSSVAMSSDTGDGRVVACLYRNNSSGGTSSTDPLKYTDLQFDTHNAYSTSTGRYTAPVSGYYSVKFSTVSTNQAEIILRKQGSNYLNMGLTNSSGGTVTPRAYGSTLVYLNAGEFIDLVPNGNLSISTSTIYFFSVERISAGSQVIATQETVSCHYINTTSQSLSGSDAIIVFPTRVVDTHGAWNTSTNRFTAPMSGMYLISTTYFNNISTSNCNTFFRRNGTTITNSYTGNSTGTNAAQPVGVHVVGLLAGDFLEVFGNTTGSSISQARVFINRIGNYA